MDTQVSSESQCEVLFWLTTSVGIVAGGVIHDMYWCRVTEDVRDHGLSQWRLDLA